MREENENYETIYHYICYIINHEIYMEIFYSCIFSFCMTSFYISKQRIIIIIRTIIRFYGCPLPSMLIITHKSILLISKRLNLNLL